VAAEGRLEGRLVGSAEDWPVGAGGKALAGVNSDEEAPEAGLVTGTVTGAGLGAGEAGGKAPGRLSGLGGGGGSAIMEEGKPGVV
jgi:hypothetical protein